MVISSNCYCNVAQEMFQTHRQAGVRQVRSNVTLQQMISSQAAYLKWFIKRKVPNAVTYCNYQPPIAKTVLPFQVNTWLSIWQNANFMSPNAANNSPYSTGCCC